MPETNFLGWLASYGRVKNNAMHFQAGPHRALHIKKLGKDSMDIYGS